MEHFQCVLAARVAVSVHEVVVHVGLWVALFHPSTSEDVRLDCCWSAEVVRVRSPSEDVHLGCCGALEGVFLRVPGEPLRVHAVGSCHSCGHSGFSP